MVWILHNEFLFSKDVYVVGDDSFFLCWFVFELLWRNPILIKICSVFSFLITLVADPSFPLNLIVSCGKFLSSQGFLNFCLNIFFRSNDDIEQNDNFVLDVPLISVCKKDYLGVFH